MLMNLATGDWDDDLLRIFEVPRAMLPRIVPSSGVAGEIAAEHLGARIPIAGIAGDQQAALAGTGLLPRGTVQEYLRHGMFRAAAHRLARPGIQESLTRHARGIHRRERAVCH